MTICDLCKNHVIKRSYITEKDVIYLVNIPRNSLQQMSLDKLNQVYQEAKTGAMVCNDCKSLCQMSSRECTEKDKLNLKAYTHRIFEDSATMKDVITELDRRINIKQVLEDLQKHK